jgi:hypothetical protein
VFKSRSSEGTLRGQTHGPTVVAGQGTGASASASGGGGGAAAHFALACPTHVIFVEVSCAGLGLREWCSAAGEEEARGGSAGGAGAAAPALPALALRVLGTLTAEPAALFTAACSGSHEALLVGREDGRLQAVTWDGAEVAYEAPCAAWTTWPLGGLATFPWAPR